MKFSSTVQRLSESALLASSLLLSAARPAEATEPITMPPAAVAGIDERPESPAISQDDAIARILGDTPDERSVEACRKLLKAGVAVDVLVNIPDANIKYYGAELENHSADYLSFIASSAHAMGQENEWLRPSTWLEGFSGASVESVEKVIELNRLRKQHAERGEPGIRGQGVDKWLVLIEGGVPLEFLEHMDSSDMYSVVRGFQEGRFPKDFLKDFTTDFEGYSRRVAESDPDYSKGVEFARAQVAEELKNREHVERPSTDYDEDISQFLAIEDPHQIFLIKQYQEYFSRPSVVQKLNDLFPVVAEEEKEEEGGIIYQGEDGLVFRHIPQYVKEGNKRGDERNTFKEPEICNFVEHLGVLHTHPGGAAFAGPSGYSKPSYGPGKYYPHGDTFSLAAASEQNPRIIEVVVTELSTGRLNIDLFLRDVKAEEGEKVVSTDPVRVIDLGIFELEPEAMKEKLAEKAALDARMAGEDSAQDLNSPAEKKVVTPEDQSDDLLIEQEQEQEQEAELSEYLDRILPGVDEWPEAELPRVVTGETLRQRMDQLRQLRDVTIETAPDFLEMLVYGAKPEQLVDVHRYHITGLTEGFRTGRYPAEFIQDLGKSHVRYSATAAISDPDASQGSKWAKEYVREKLEAREHLFRLKSDYDEGIKTLDATNDKYMLFLIKRYVDFFNEPENWESLENLFRPSAYQVEERSKDRQPEFATPERGGLMLHRDGKIKFQEILQPLSRRIDPEAASKGYQSSHLQFNAVALGGLHTHPLDLVLDPRRSGDPAEVAGPSGHSHVEKGMDKYAADTGSLRYFNQGSPFGVDVVITELGSDRYNVDIYYRDVTESADGKAVNNTNVSVLDLGVFEPAKERLTK